MNAGIEREAHAKMRRMTMRVSLVLGVILGLTASGFGQLKSDKLAQPTASQSVLQSESSNLLFGILNPANMSMRHSFSFSYATFGGKGMTVGMYTNSLFYKISDPLNVQVDVSLLHSPSNTLGGNVQNSLNGIYITRAELNYRPTENTWLQIQYRQLPGMSWYMDPYSSPWLFGPTHDFRQEGH